MIHSIQILFLLHTVPALLGLSSCHPSVPPTDGKTTELVQSVKPGAWQTELYYPLLQGKTYGFVCNHTSTIGFTHLVDTLIRAGLKPTRLFAPEHGFRGDLPDGQFFGNKQDPVTKLEVVSLHGKKKKPEQTDLDGLDVLLFDIQDVGVRCYTYLSTLHYIMEAAAEKGIPVIVLDRPNPNGHYIDGPVLDTAYRSFVGMHPVPLVYGLTIGEYAKMINGEGWLEDGRQCDLTVIPVANYDRTKPYQLPERPSPNLPNMLSVYLYPSLCFFEGTSFSIGRGTDYPFQLIGHPACREGDTYFMPVPRPESTTPPQQNQQCRGWDLSDIAPATIYRKAQIDLDYLIQAYFALPDGELFFLKTNYLDKISGSTILRTQIGQGLSAEQIRATWTPGLDAFAPVRRKYLLYADLE